MSNTKVLNRRAFLENSAALVTAVAAPVASFAEESMLTRLIPGTDEALPVVGLGANRVLIIEFVGHRKARYSNRITAFEPVKNLALVALANFEN